VTDVTPASTVDFRLEKTLRSIDISAIGELTNFALGYYKMGRTLAWQIIEVPFP